jgi:hypothetical protein
VSREARANLSPVQHRERLAGRFWSPRARFAPWRLQASPGRLGLRPTGNRRRACALSLLRRRLRICVPAAEAPAHFASWRYPTWRGHDLCRTAPRFERHRSSGCRRREHARTLIIRRD